jgi:hypothetical protein
MKVTITYKSGVATIMEGDKVRAVLKIDKGQLRKIYFGGEGKAELTWQ